MQYRAEIDGLRAVAVLPVILFHAGIGFFSGGYIGVDVFFVISGYLISTIIITQASQSAFSLVNFYENRARRILPALFFVMLCCLPFAWAWMNLYQWYEFSESMVWTTFFASNVFFWLHSGYFASASEMKPLLHTWSLAVEEQFYLFFPLIIMLFWKLGKRTLWVILGVIGCFSFYHCVQSATSSPGSNFFLTLSRIWELLVGVLCAVIIMRRAELAPIKRDPLVSEFLTICGLLMILASVCLFDQNTPFPSAYTLFPVLGTAFIILWAGPETLVGRFLSNRAFVFIGLISYSAYLWHQPIFAFARIRMLDEPSLPQMLTLAALSLGLASLTWKFVEQPFRKKKASKKNFSKATALSKRAYLFTTALVGMLFFAGTGYAFGQKLITRPGDAAARLIEARLQKVHDERVNLLQVNRCHIGDIANWRTRWDCEQTADINAALQPVGIAIVGDSHAADKAGTLRIHGLVPLQYTAPVCGLVPSLMRKNCRQYFEHAREQITNNDDISELWLANDYTPKELSEASLLEMIEFWSATGKKLKFFAHVPVYEGFTEKMLIPIDTPRYVEPTVNFSLYDYSSRPQARTILESQDVDYMDTVALLCGSKENCAYETPDGALMVTDKAHFALSASRIFGRSLICSGQSTALEMVINRQNYCISG